MNSFNDGFGKLLICLQKDNKFRVREHNINNLFLTFWYVTYQNGIQIICVETDQNVYGSQANVDVNYAYMFP